jgi:sorbitol-specific phosphotransferase system component IIA
MTTQASPKLSNIQALDTINYKGKNYSIVSVGSYVDDKYGRGHITVTFTVLTASDTTITCSTADTILSSFHVDQSGTAYATWSQTVKP